MRLDCHKNKGGLLMLFKETNPFVDNTTTLPQSADPHLKQKGISITMPNLQQLHICKSTFHHVAVAALVTTHRSRTTKCHIVGNINLHHTRWDANTNENERGEQLVNKVDAADYAIHYMSEAMWLPTNGRST